MRCLLCYLIHTVFDPAHVGQLAFIVLFGIAKARGVCTGLLVLGVGSLQPVLDRLDFGDATTFQFIVQFIVCLTLCCFLMNFI
ncbi:hypothetical protein ASD28_22965 [Massilia sp. Root133]|nr:hypothetical protein ASD28_22965 [Massilia sp. Root133]KQZ44460.1 hypothetical protein ASD92_28330 [Massilia sp. Root1485]